MVGPFGLTGSAMPLSALALVLVAAVLHATWNIAAKRASGGAHFVLLSALFLCVLWAPVGGWFLWTEGGRLGPVEWGVLVASGFVHLVYFNVLLAGYRAADLTVVYPVARGTGPLIASAGAVVVLGEQLSALGLLGVVGVGVGVFLIAGGPGLLAAGHDRRLRLRLGIGWGAATGVLIAAYTVLDGYAVKVLAIAPILVDYVGNLVRVPFMVPSALHDRAGFIRDLRTHWRAALLLAALSPLGYVLVLYAVKVAPLSHVAPAREVSMLFAALLGGKLLGEEHRAARLVGAAAIAGGVVALAWG